MPRCGCQDTCSCLITAGPGVTVEGIGTIERPYEISTETDVGNRIVFTDDGNVDFTTTGTGSAVDPLVVQASAELAFRDLTDVSDSDTPVTGDIVKWDGSQWVFEPVGPSLPNGGTAGQVLTKQSATNGDAIWAAPVKELPPGGLAGQSLVKTSATDYAVNWATVSGGGGFTPVETTEFCLLRKNTLQTLTNAVETPITFDAAVCEDPNGMWNGSDLITIRKDGVYLIQLQYAYAASSAGNRITIVRINGSTARQWYHVINSTAAQIHHGTVSIQRNLKAGDTVQMRQYQSTGGNLDTYSTAPSQSPGLAVVRIGGGGIASERVYASARAHQAATSVNSAASTPVPFDTPVYEDGIAWNGVDGFIIPVTGYYQINAILTWAASNSTGVRGALITVNNSAHQSDVVTPNAGSQVVSASSSVVAKLTAGDVVRVNAYQTSGAALALSANTAYNRISIVKVPETIPASNGIIGERVYASARGQQTGYSLATGTAHTVMSFEVDVKTDGIAWDATNNGFIIPVSGWYHVDGAMQFGSHAAGYRLVAFAVNGTQFAVASDVPAAANGGQSVVLAHDRYFSAGDLVQLRVAQNSGVSLAFAASPSYNYFQITKIPSVFPQSVAIGERNYAVSRRHAALTSINNNVQVTLPWDTADTPTFTDGITYDGAGNFTVPVAGYYRVDGTVCFATNATGSRYVYVQVNAITQATFVNSGAAAAVTYATTIKCAAGDVIRTNVLQNSGAALTMNGSPFYNWISIAKVPSPVVAGSAASGSWGSAPLDRYGSDSLVGRDTYIDSRGQLRAKPIVMPGASAGLDGNSTPSDWPIGFHSLYLTASDTGAASGWPTTSAFAFVTTHRYGNEAIQMWQRLTTGVYGVAGGASEIKIRSGNTSSGWTPWINGTGPDTGWLPITWSASGWTMTQAPQARRIGRVVHLRGRVSNASFAAVANHTSLGTLPAAIPYPPVSVLLPVACYGTTVYQRSFQVTSAGDFAAQTSLANANYWDLTGSYLIDDAAV